MKARLANLKVVIGFDKSGLRQLNKDIRDTRGKFRRNFGEIAGMAKNAALAITGSLVAGVGMLIRQGAKMETLRTGFISITGSANKAAAVVKDLNDFAAKTPFQLNEISSAARKLLATGSQRSALTEELKFLGDVAASSGNSIDEIAAIFTKVRAKGKVELENLNQLAERNIPIFDELRKVTGDANMEFGAGAVSVADFTEALRGMAEQGGIADGAMENLSQTVEGRITTLLDNASQELAGFAEKSGIIDVFGAQVAAATEQLQGLSGVTKTDISAALGLAEEAMDAFGTASVDNVDDVETAMRAAQDAIKDVMAEAQAGAKQRIGLSTLFGGVGGGKAAAKDLAQSLAPLVAIQKALADAGSELNSQMLDGSLAAEGLGDAASNLADEFDAYNDVSASSVNPLLTDSLEEQHFTVEGLAEAYADLAGVFNNMQIDSSMLEDIQLDPEVIDEADQVAERYGQSLLRLRDTAKQVAIQVQQAFENTAETLASVMGEAIGQALAGTDNALRNMANTMLMTLASLAVEVGQIAIGVGLAITGIRKALTKLNPVTAILAGIALVAIGTATRAALQGAMDKRAEADIPHMAAGGLFTGASLAVVGEGPGTSMSNPEVVAPLDKLQQMIGGGNVTVSGVIRGNDILISNERSVLDRNRVRGF